MAAGYRKDTMHDNTSAGVPKPRQGRHHPAPAPARCRQVPGDGGYQHDSATPPGLRHTANMILWAELATLVVLIGGAMNVIAPEYRQLRNRRRYHQLLRRTFCMAAAH